MGTTNFELMVLAGLGILAVFVAGRAWGTFRRFRAARVVVCPATRQPAAVQVDARHAALTAIPVSVLRVKACSRWPAEIRCGQLCLDEVEAAARPSPVLPVLALWYGRKVCAFCGSAFAPIEWVERPPFLQAPGGWFVPWFAAPQAGLAETLETCRPVCWACHQAHALRSQDRRPRASVATPPPGMDPADPAAFSGA